MSFSASLLLLASTASTVFADPLTAIQAVTQQQWNTLNSTVGGGVFQAAPFARPCFERANVTTGSFNAEECNVIQQNYLNSSFRAGLPGNYEGTQWEGCPATGQTCLLDNNNPFSSTPFTGRVCSQGSVPDFFVDVRGPADVQAAFAFAEQTGVRIIIKNSGHDFLGRSSGPNTLAIRTSNLKNLTYIPEFVPEGCKNVAPRPAAAMGAGVIFEESYPFGEAHNISLPGGGCPTVSPGGGYTLGGGHGMMVNEYGLGADRALQFKVVTPTGEFLTANECQNTDLWFALRGGGGGTFGVVLETVQLALPRNPVQMIQIQDFENTDENTRAYMKIVLEHTKEWALQGWGGFVQLNEFQYINDVISSEDAIEAMKPLTDWAQTVNATIIQKTSDSYVAYWQEFLFPVFNPTGLPFSLASRLIPSDNFETEEKREELLNATLEAAAGHAAWFGFATTPFKYGANENTSATPAWRNALWHVIVEDIWNFDTTSDQQQQILQGLSTSIDAYRKITPGSGSYLNEADINEPNFSESFWGSNYDRLVSIKDKYDPNHLLDCWRCVGFKGTDDDAYSCYL